MDNNTGIERRIEEIEEEIKNTPYNKATQHHIGKLKAKLAQLRENLIKKKSGGKGAGFGIRKVGDATVVLVGFPSVGKSTLINRLTDAKSKIADYEFTTLDVVPGIMNYRGVKIQIVDLPGLIDGASTGRGRGRKVLSVVRNADLVLILLDAFHTEQLEVIERELYNAGIRLGEDPPRVKIKKTSRGGIILSSSVEVKQISERTVKGILLTKGIHSAEVTLHEDLNEDRFIDAVMGNRVYIPSIIALNKIDRLGDGELDVIVRKLKKRVILISAKKGSGLDRLMDEVLNKLDLIRIYMKPQGNPADYDEPLIMKKDSKIEDICMKIHRDFKNRFRYARVWGKSARFGGQKKGLNHKVEDEDVVSIILD